MASVSVYKLTLTSERSGPSRERKPALSWEQTALWTDPHLRGPGAGPHYDLWVPDTFAFVGPFLHKNIVIL